MIGGPTPVARAVSRAGRSIGIAVAVATLALGLHVGAPFDSSISTAWKALALSLHAIPLIGLFLPWTPVRVGALWFGVFLMLQDIASPLVVRDLAYYVTLPANMDESFTVVGDGLPGIRGTQRVTTDHRGFRVEPPIDYDSEEGFRIFALGGSTTEQIYLDDQATWTYLLQEQLKQRLDRHVEVVNTGVSGLRSSHHLSTLRQVIEWNPDCVIFMLGGNDWNKHIKEHFGSRYYVSFQWTLMGHGLRRLFDALDGILSDAPATSPGQPREERGNFHAARRGSLERDVVKTFLPDRVSESYRRHLDAIGDQCKATDAHCLFVTQPHGYDVNADQAFIDRFWMTPPNERFTLNLASMSHIAGLYSDYLRQWTNERGYDLIDLAGVIEPGFNSFYDDVHFNSRGAATVAKIIADHLATGLCGLDVPAGPPSDGDEGVR